jgi:modulator of FtsH protease HflK
MSEVSPQGDRRAQLAALAGLVIQTLLFAAITAVGVWQEWGSDAVIALARHLLGGLAIWLILVVVYTQRRRSRLEDLETEQLRRAQASGLATNLFDAGDESLLLERRRLAWTYRFLLPLFTIVLAIYHVGGTFVAWSWPLGRSIDHGLWTRTSQPFIVMVFAASSAFICFVYARYVIGLARQPNYRLLRAGGSYLLGCSLSSVVLAVSEALAGGTVGSVWAEPLAAYIIRFSVLILGLEMVVNFILEFYRPRKADEEIRPAFDSRLLALLSEPGGIIRSLADTINYQFGFEVSGTWFYKLLQRSVFPLVVMTLLVLVLLSSIVIVDVDEEAFVEHFGALSETEAPLQSGFHVKFPWPIDRVVRARVSRVRSVMIGSEEEEAWKKREGVSKDDHGDHGEQGEHDDHDDHTEELEREEEALERDSEMVEHEQHHAILWTEEHEHLSAHSLVIVANSEIDASESVGGDLGDRSHDDHSHGSHSHRGHSHPGSGRGEGVSLLMVSADIQFHIENLHDYSYRYQEPVRVLKSVAFQELSDFAAGHDATDLMGRGLASFAEELRDRIQQRCDDMRLGLKTTMVNVHAHPPATSGVASQYQEVIAAEIRKSASTLAAHGGRDRILTETAGSVELAKRLDAAIVESNRLGLLLREDGDNEAMSRKLQEIDADISAYFLGDRSRGIKPVSGRASAILAGARAMRSLQVSRAESKLRSFQNDLAAYRASPRLFMIRRYLETLGKSLPRLRKYVFTGDPAELVVEYETKQRAYLDLSTEEEPAG